MPVRRFCQRGIVGFVGSGFGGWGCRLAGAVLLLGPVISRAEPGDLWLRQYGLEAWQWDLDFEPDGLTVRQEYAIGGDPFGADLDVTLELSGFGPDLSLTWEAIPGQRFQVLESPDAAGYVTLGAPITATDARPSLAVEALLPIQFFGLSAVQPLDGDEDGLSDLEEALFSGTRPDLRDTDGDTIPDGVEVLMNLGDPLTSVTEGGRIEGRVWTDPDGDGDVGDGSPVEGARVYLDLDFDGSFGPYDAWVETGADGGYAFGPLPPGLYAVRQDLPSAVRQTLPATGAHPVADGLADELVEYTHTPGGPFDVPYGLMADEFAAFGYIIFPPEPEPVDPALILKPIGRRADTPAVGAFPWSEWLTMPQDSTVLLRYDEWIIDGPGEDLLVYSIDAAADEKVEIAVGPAADRLTVVGTLAEAPGGSVLDLEVNGIQEPVRYVQLRSLDSGGSFPGFDLVGVVALHYAAPSPGAHMVEILDSETVTGRDFGRAFQDDPPTVYISYEDPGRPPRVGDEIQVRVRAFDDIRVASRSLTANGQAVPLDVQHKAILSLPAAGAVALAATAIDDAGHMTEAALTVYVADTDGMLPFDPAYLPIDSGMVPGAPHIRLFSPATGSVPTGDTPVVATVEADTDVQWALDVASFDQVDPQDLFANDPDYVSLGSGTGHVVNAALADFPAGSLAPGVYLLRMTAQATTGGPHAANALVLGVGLDVASLGVEIELTGPTAGTDVLVAADVIGSIRSARPVSEWYLEVAPADRVDVNDPGAPGTEWVRFAEGTGTMENSLMGVLDATRFVNGSYLVRAVAWNDLKLGRVELLPVEIQGVAKFGRLVRVFTDLSISLVGFPLEVRRVYDSFQAGRIGDFGYGWSLGFLDPDIQETAPDTGSGFFGATPFRDGTRVYLTAPDGTRVGFTFRPEVGASSLLGAVYRAVFEPDPGVYHRLEVPEGDTPFLTLDAEGNARLYLFGFAYNPSRYHLVTPDGDRYTFDERDGFVEAEDPNGNTLTLEADGLVHSLGPRLAITRDAQGRISRVENPGGLGWNYVYDAAGDLVSVTDPDGMETTLAYVAGSPHYLKEVTDPFGRLGTRYEYDGDGRLAAVIDEAGNRVEQDWAPAAFEGSVTDRRGHTTLLAYDARGNITRREDPMGGITRYEYTDPTNPDLPTAITDANSHTTRLEYDPNGKLVKQLNPINFREVYTAAYDEAGRVQTINDVDGSVSVYAYDAVGNLTTRAPAFAPAEQFEYSPEGLPVVVRMEDGFETRRAFAGDGSLMRVEDDDGVALDVVTNPSGQIRSITDSEGATWRFDYMADGTPRTQMDPLDRSRTLTRLPDGAMASEDRTGRRTVYSLDADQRLRKVVLPDLTDIEYAYDPGGNVTGVTDTLGNTTVFDYDKVGRNTGGHDADGNVLSVQLDPVGNVTDVTDRNGKRRSFEYDDNDRLLFERWHGPTGEVVRVFAYTYARGRLASVSDGDARWSISGLLPRPTQWTVEYPGQTAWVVNYSWHQGGRAPGPTSIRVRPDRKLAQGSMEMAYRGAKLRGLAWNHPDGDGGQVQFGFAADGVMDRIARFPVSGSSQAQTAFSSTSFDLDEMNFVTGIRHLDGAGAPLAGVGTMNLVRDAEGRVTEVVQDSDAATVQLDDFGQIVGVSHSSRPAESYQYDAVGNRVSSHQTPGPATVDPGHRLRALGDFAFDYDLEGNLVERVDTVSGEVRRYEYDHRNQLVRATHRPGAVDPATTVVEYEYDFAQRMVSRTVNGEKTWILWDRLMPIAEFPDGGDRITAFFFYHPERMDHYLGAWREGIGERWFLTDHIGTVRGTLDGAGNLIGWTDFDTFGISLGSPIESIGHGGRRYVPELGLYENRLRFYDPIIGRFIQEDPLGIAGGDVNPYRFAFNNPLLYTDASGQLAAVEYASLASALTRPGVFCKFAKCVADLWSGVTTAVLTLETTGEPPNATCPVTLVGLPCNADFPNGCGFGEANKVLGAALTLTKNGGLLPPPGLGDAVAIVNCLSE